jgi:hypothetical protein
VPAGSAIVCPASGDRAGHDTAGEAMLPAAIYAVEGLRRHSVVVALRWRQAGPTGPSRLADRQVRARGAAPPSSFETDPHDGGEGRRRRNAEGVRWWNPQLIDKMPCAWPGSPLRGPRSARRACCARTRRGMRGWAAVCLRLRVAAALPAEVSQVVALADWRAKMAQDRVNGRDVEEEIWDDEVADVVVSAEPAPHNARVQLERVRLRAGEVIWLQPLQKAAPLRQSPLERRVHHGRRTRRWALALEELCHVRIHFVAAHAELLAKRKHIPLINQANRSDPLI